MKSDISVPNKELVSKIFSVLSSESRLKALELFSQNMELNEIAKAVGMSRSGFQKVVDSFRELGLIERAGHRSYYRLTKEGERILELVRNFGEDVKIIKAALAKGSLQEMSFKFGLTKDEVIKILEEMENE